MGVVAQMEVPEDELVLEFKVRWTRNSLDELRERDRQTDRYRETDRQRDRERETDRQKEREM